MTSFGTEVNKLVKEKLLLLVFASLFSACSTSRLAGGEHVVADIVKVFAESDEVSRFMHALSGSSSNSIRVYEFTVAANPWFLSDLCWPAPELVQNRSERYRQWRNEFKPVRVEQPLQDTEKSDDEFVLYISEFCPDRLTGTLVYNRDRVSDITNFRALGSNSPSAYTVLFAIRDSEIIEWSSDIIEYQ